MYFLFNEILVEVADDAFEGCVYIGQDGEEMDFSVEAMSGYEFAGRAAQPPASTSPWSVEL